MNVWVRVLLCVPVVLYYVLQSVVLCLIPKKYRFKDITGQTVLITGAGRGIGRELANKFSLLGVRLVLLDIDKKGLKTTASQIDQDKCPVSLYECDVSKKEEVYAVAKKIKQDVGNVNILVNNAGIITCKRFLSCPDDRIQKTLEINTLANFWTCKAFLPEMMADNQGHLVFVSSLAGYGGLVRHTDYCASKYAVVGFEETLRLELEQDGLDGIKTTLVAPYVVNTGLLDGYESKVLPALNPAWVAERIVSGVLVDQEVIFIPSFFYLLVALAAVIPRRAVREIQRATGLAESLDKDLGRKKSF